MPSFSVVTPNLNMGQFLPATIDSVLANLSPGDEYLVVDGGSKDHSVDILKAYDHRLTGWLSEPDHGYADAVAKGFARTSGTFLCWINSGDILLPGALDRARSEFARTQADMLFGDDFHIDANGTILSYSRGWARDLRRMMLFGRWTPLQDACFWTRSLYSQVGGLDRSLRRAGDFDLFLRFSLQGTCVYTPYIFSAFRKHEGQISIREQAAYRAEREACRNRELRALGMAPLAALSVEFFFRVAAKVRARISHPRWARTQPSGGRIQDEICRASDARSLT